MAFTKREFSSPQSPCLDSPPRLLVVSAVVIVCGLAFLLRCLHLLQDDHYFIVSPDSHYFHLMAQLLVQGETYFYPTHGQLFPITMFSGIAYPLAFMSRLLVMVTPLSPLESLELTSKLLPPALGAVTALVLYLAASRLFGRAIGLLSAFAWAVVPVGILGQAAGYLDRDSLSILLITSGVFLFYFLSDSHITAAGRPVGWAASAAAVIAIQVLLYIEWGFLGPVILIAVLAGCFLLQVLSDLIARVMPAVLAEEDPLRMPFTLARRVPGALSVALQRSPYQAIALLAAVNLAATAFRPTLFVSIYNAGMGVFRGAVAGQATVQELEGLGSADVFSYGFLLIPAAIGLYIAVRRRSRADLLALGWFVTLFVLGLFARRLFMYAAPALCLLSGLGLAAFLDIRGLRSPAYALSIALVHPRVVVPYLRVGCAVILVLATLLSSAAFAYTFASAPPTSADSDWYETLVWLRENTPEDAIIMTWWDYGYWILDVAQRVPVVDNGFHPEATDTDIRRVYLATNDFDAVETMKRYYAGYLIFSKVETRFFPGLNADFGDLSEAPQELQDSLYVRSFSETFHSDAGLQRVYHSAGPAESSVVIIALT